MTFDYIGEIHCIEIGNDSYLRFYKDSWMENIGASLESIYNEERLIELEKAFQEFK